jgi:hypothetical protein
MEANKPEKEASNASELAEWEEELERLQSLRPVLTTRNRMRQNEIPDMEKEIKKVEKVSTDCNAAEEEVRTLVTVYTRIIYSYLLGERQARYGQGGVARCTEPETARELGGTFAKGN